MFIYFKCIASQLKNMRKCSVIDGILNYFERRHRPEDEQGEGVEATHNY